MAGSAGMYMSVANGETPTMSASGTIGGRDVWVRGRSVRSVVTRATLRRAESIRQGSGTRAVGLALRSVLARSHDSPPAVRRGRASGRSDDARFRNSGITWEGDVGTTTDGRRGASWHRASRPDAARSGNVRCVFARWCDRFVSVLEMS